MAQWIQLNAQNGRSVKSIQATTEAGPPSFPGDGANLNDVGGFLLWAEADTGQTFTGSGALVAYSYDPDIGPSRSPDQDVTFTAAMAGQRRVTFPPVTVASPRGLIAHLANSVGVSGGGVTLYYTCSTLLGART